MNSNLDNIPNEQETDLFEQQISRSDAFLCYSRQDGAFAEDLVTRLTKLGRNISIDRHNIRGGEAWQRKLGFLIQNADNVIFLISSAALASSYCRWELDYAGELNKRLINVVVHLDNLHDVPTSISAIQYINADGSLALDRIVSEVVSAIETDQDWAEYHTQLELRAKAWKEQEAGLLRDSEFNLAETQILKYQGRRPFITELQSTLLLESQKAAQRRFRWAGLALIGVTLLAVFGISTWIGRGQEETRRSLGETRNYFFSGDQIGAVLPLNKLAHPSLMMDLVQDPAVKRSGQNLFNAWVARLIPLEEIIDRSPGNSLLFLNDQPVLKLSSRTLQVLDPKGDFRLIYIPTLSVYTYVDAVHLSVHDSETFKPLYTLALEGRTQIVGIYQIEPLEMILIAVERREVTNDEDEPNSISTDVYAIVRKSNQLVNFLCEDQGSSIASIEETNLCSPIDLLPSTGEFSAFTVAHLPENYRIESIAISKGATPFAEITLKLDCDFKDECARSTMLDVLKITRYNPASKEHQSASSFRKQITEPITSSPMLTISTFPAIRPEVSFWNLQNSTAQPVEKSLNSLQKLDFSLMKDDYDYAQFFESIDLSYSHDNGMFCKGGKYGVWSFAPGGNSWAMVVKCFYNSAGLVSNCSNDMGLTVIDAVWVKSPNNRYLAHRVCSSTEPSLSVYDMTRTDNEPMSLDISPTLVLGSAFNLSGNRLAVLTDQHELWIYAIKPDSSIQREKIIVLPGKREAVSCEKFLNNILAFADDKILVGVDQGSILFAANVDSSEILWTSKGQNLPASLLEQAQHIQVNAEAGFFLLNSSNTLAIFDTKTGLPVSDAIDTVAWKTTLDRNISTEDIRIEKVAIERNGRISVVLSSFYDQLLVRNNPTDKQFWSSKCMPLEMLTGLDENGRRMKAKDLLRIYFETKDCGR